MNTFNMVFLGTGTSVGVPVIGCDCRVCKSSNPKNKRLRSSVVFKSENTTLLIDSGPDLRQQAMRAELFAVDAVLYTHSHLDHVAGFDELRAFCWRREDRLPLYGNEETLGALKRMYPWAFAKGNQSRGYVRPEARLIEAEMQIGDFKVQPVAVQHGGVETHGYVLQVGNSERVAYLPDYKFIKEESWPLLEGVDCLVVDALRYADREHPTHATVEDSVELGEKVRAKRVVLTHISHEVEHEEVAERTPGFVSPAFDGLEIKF